MRTLLSIFNFYSSQHLELGPNPTFSRIEHNYKRMTLGDYLKFVQDFKILQECDILPQDIKQTCANAFNTVSDNKREIDFFAFRASLYLVFRIEYNKGIVSKGGRIKKLTKIISKGEVKKREYTYET